MKYYEYDINYDAKNGSMGVVAVPKKMKSADLLIHLQKIGEVEPVSPRDFDCDEITKKEYEEEVAR